MKRHSLLLLAFAWALVSCGGDSSNTPGGGGSGGGSGGGGSSGETPPPPGAEETVVIGAPGLCAPGDVARVDFSTDGSARFALVNEDVTCTPAKDNRREEYTLILYNTTATPMTFSIQSPVSATPIETGRWQNFINQLTGVSDEHPAPKPPTGPSSPSELRNESTRLTDALVAQKKPKRLDYGKSTYRQRLLQRTLSVNDEVEFRIRNSNADPDSFTTSSAILRAQGTRINLFLDRDAPFGGGNADSLTQAQVDSVVDVFDDNIYPLVTGLLGDPSDVDGDGRINVVITPVLNRDLKCDLTASYVESFTDTRNLLPFDAVSNPVSNESEVIFAYAPDSLLNYNTNATEALATNNDPAALYVEYLKAWLAYQLTHLVSYNQHVLLQEDGVAEADWINDGLGAVMADLAGFNIWRPRARTFYLDFTHMRNLKEVTTFDCDAKANYLFMLYYVYSQLDNTLSDSNGNGFDDSLEFVSQLMTSNLTGDANLENAVDFEFDDTIETEFQAIFKDWLISLATSGSDRTDLQQNDQDAVKYYYNLNPTNLGSGIGNGSGSVRAGASGNPIGIDLNGVNPGGFLIENADEHVYAPGNLFNGYIYPYSAMFVRLTGLFREQQVISIRASTGNLKGFIVRRSDISYPKTYSESIFGSIDQHFEDLDSEGPNPYWTNQGIAKRLDLESLIASAPLNGTSKEFVSIVGRIDKPSKVDVCPANPEECAPQDVPDTDKFIFTVPDLGRGDEGSLVIAVRRYHDDGSELSSLNPLLAVVSSKDVPYPYVPHPIRNQVNGPGTDTRQPYRWLTSQLICGDDQVAGDTALATNVAGYSCTPGLEDNSFKILFEDGKFVENSGQLLTAALDVWDGDIRGGQCDALPTEPLGVEGAGYGMSLAYPVTTVEAGGSPLGKYSFTDSFMTLAYGDQDDEYPDVLFNREFIKPVASYPPVRASSDEAEFDPRSINQLTLNCHEATGGGEPDTAKDAPDDILEPAELFQPGTLAGQIMAEMARARVTSAGAPESTTLAPQYDDVDTLVINKDNRDTDTCFTEYDFVHNVNTLTVRTGEGALVAAGHTDIPTHIVENLNNSVLSGPDQPDQYVYVSPPSDTLTLTPGKNYTIIVGGVGGSVGPYEIRIRKVATPTITSKCGA